LVFIRYKKIKGHQYAYLVKNNWNIQNKKVRQEIIKYLGRSSKLRKEDVPPEYQNDPKILDFFSNYSTENDKTDAIKLELQDELLNHFTNGTIDELPMMYEKYQKLFKLSRIFGLAKFYDQILTPVMYRVGELWESGKIDVATEHVCSNLAENLVRIINDRYKTDSSLMNKSRKILMCTPEGELHSLACLMLESIISRMGFSVFNAAPSVPYGSLVSYIKDLDPYLILISITLRDNFPTLLRLINRISESYPVPILVGGMGIVSESTRRSTLQNVRFLAGHLFEDIMKIDILNSHV
jgi:MerR family transcriptional regulator, light-induced transcriptional regulator